MELTIQFLPFILEIRIQNFQADSNRGTPQKGISMSTDLTGTTALVTGTTSGIGREQADLVAASKVLDIPDTPMTRSPIQSTLAGATEDERESR